VLLGRTMALLVPAPMTPARLLLLLGVCSGGPELGAFVSTGACSLRARPALEASGARFGAGLQSLLLPAWQGTPCGPPGPVRPAVVRFATSGLRGARLLLPALPLTGALQRVAAAGLSGLGHGQLTAAATAARRAAAHGSSCLPGCAQAG